jgi:hypothetical protein
VNAFSARLALLTLLAGLFLLTSGCGYHHEELYPEGIQTIQLAPVENRSFYRGVEFELAEALIKEIERRTPYKVTQGNTADTIMRVTVMRVDQRRLSRTRPGGLPQELEFVLAADFEWQNQRTGKSLRKRDGLTAIGRYVPAQPVGEVYEVAQHQATQRMATMLVDAMRADW